MLLYIWWLFTWSMSFKQIFPHPIRKLPNKPTTYLAQLLIIYIHIYTYTHIYLYNIYILYISYISTCVLYVSLVWCTLLSITLIIQGFITFRKIKKHKFTAENVTLVPASFLTTLIEILLHIKHFLLCHNEQALLRILEAPWRICFGHCWNPLLPLHLVWSRHQYSVPCIL